MDDYKQEQPTSNLYKIRLTFYVSCFILTCIVPKFILLDNLQYEEDGLVLRKSQKESTVEITRVTKYS